MIRKNLLIILLLILLSLPAVYFILLPGVFEPHDLHHIADIYQMARAFASGQIPPRLGPDFSFGYSYPLFNFYYVMPFYLGGLWYFLTGSLTGGFEFVFFISLVTSVIAMYLFLNQFVGKIAAFSGSVIFLYTPYRAVQVYVRGAMGEALAIALLPWIFLAVIKLAQKPNSKTIAFSALMFSIFILSHNYFFALTLPFAFIYIYLLLIKLKNKRQFAFSLIKTSAIALGLSAYWWLPALIEQKLVASQTPFPLIDHFPFIKQLIIPGWGYGASVWGPGDGLSFQIGIVNVAAVLVSGTLFFFRKRLLKNKKIRILFYWAFASFFISIIFMNIRSYPLWKTLPFYNFIQFPWRLLAFTTFFSAVITSVLIHSVPLDKRLLTSIFVMLAAVILTFSYFRPSKIVRKSDGEYLEHFFDNPGYSEDYLLLPKWSYTRPLTKPDSKIAISDGEIKEAMKLSDIRWNTKLYADKPTKVTFNSYYFPGWYARLDGLNTVVSAGKPYGQIEVDIPEGEHSLEFYWTETNLRKFADFISVLSFGILIFLWFKKEKSYAAKPNS